jgi:predicted DCC family thiol-disulfide oxidoreductase YuxK
LEIVSFRHDSGYVAYGISAEDLERRMYAVDVRRGRVLQGFEAARAVARELPLLWPLRLVFAVASLLRVGDVVYDFLAARRLIIPDPRACAGQCES